MHTSSRSLHDYARRVTDRRRSASLTRRTLDVVLFSVVMWAVLDLWVRAGQP